MHRNAVSLIETLARHPLHHASPEAQTGRTARVLKLWAQLDRAVRTFPEEAKAAAAALRKQAEDYRGEDNRRAAEAEAAAETVEWAAIGAGVLA